MLKQKSLQRYSGHRALISPDATKSYINCSFNAGNELDLHVSQQSQNNDHQMHLFLCVDCSLPHIGLIRLGRLQKNLNYCRLSLEMN